MTHHREPPLESSVARELRRDLGRGLVEDVAALLLGILWWATCLGLAGGLGYLIGGDTGLLVGLAAGVLLALLGWVLAIVLGARGMLARWRDTRR